MSTFDRNQYDVKINWNRSPGHQVWGKIGVMDATVSSLQKLSFEGGGYAKTKTWVATIGQTFVPSKSFVIDTTFGYSLLDQYGWGPITNQLRPGARRARTNDSDFARAASVVGQRESTLLDRPLEPYRGDPSYTGARKCTKLAGKTILGSAGSTGSHNHGTEFGGTVHGRSISRQPAGCASPDPELYIVRGLPLAHIRGADGHPWAT